MFGGYLRINKRQVQFFAKAGFGRIIYADGMPRSGSTLLFNIIRLVLLSNPDCRLSSGWVRDARNLPAANTYLIKTHSLNALDTLRSNKTFYSYRDLRDALVSLLRKGGETPSMKTAHQWVEWFEAARKNAHLMVRYEDMTADVPAVVRLVAAEFGYEVDVDDIVSRLPTGAPDRSSRAPYSPTTLLHQAHKTGTASGEWRTLFEPAFRRQINSELGWWFEQNGYEAA
jgi:hypothetical protein